MKICVPKVPKSVSNGNVTDTLLLTRRKETRGNTLRKIDLAYLLSQLLLHLLANKNTLCAVQITWHGGVKQRAATANQPWERHTSVKQDLAAAESIYFQNNVAALQAKKS